MSTGGVIGWWCKSRDLTVASIRIRAAQVMQGLRERGLAAEWFDPQAPIARYRAVVLSKRYDDETVRAAQRLSEAGCRVVLDLCDNNFVAASDQAGHQRRVDNLLQLAALAEVIVVTTGPLADIVAQHCPNAPPAQVIGDLADDLSAVPCPLHRRPALALKRWREGSHLQALGRAGVTRLVWFGNAEGRLQQSGLVDLQPLVPLLARLRAQHPLHLSVISNSRERWREWVDGRGVPTRYLDWDAWTFDELLGQHDVALIPAALNEFTVCKTDNRVVSALRAGVAVVASALPSYEVYGDTIALGDFERGLSGYLADPGTRRADAARGRLLAERLGAAGPLLDRWQAVLLDG